MINVSVTLNGLDKALQNITDFAVNSEAIVDGVLENTADRTASDAALFAPPGIAGTISVINEPLSKTVHVDNPIAAYVEFGTGEFVQGYPFDDVFPSGGELRDYAMTFFVNGKGRLAPHPYLFPAFMQNSQDIDVKLGIQIEEAGDMA
jgi:hypothetical protein